MRLRRQSERTEATQEKVAIVTTSLSESSLRGFEHEASKSERQRVLRGVKVITPDGVEKIQIGPGSPHQVMVNTFQQTTYVPPHSHTDKWEYFSMEEIGKGKLKVICFSPNGRVASVEYLTPGKCSSLTIPEGIYHTVVAMEDGTQVEEIKPKKFEEASDKVLAEWAPSETSNERFEFRRWLEICVPGDEASNSTAILKAHDSKMIEKISDHREILEQITQQQQEILRSHSKIQATQEKILQENNELKTCALAAINIARCDCSESQKTGILAYLFSFWVQRNNSISSQPVAPSIVFNVSDGGNVNFFASSPPPTRKMSSRGDQVQVMTGNDSDSQVRWCGLGY